jgi:hypothetical protein
VTFNRRDSKITLSSLEIAYLRDKCALDSELLEMLITAQPHADHRSYLVRVSQEAVGRFAEALTKRLARVGFDEKYEPTREGKVLEDLIDRFHV